ncbi:hypothetical protein FCM35_KLT09101 [Carex littledalei]|uniref:Uncharacterized protein n=1 Tax=Carex littledalei TaxID=544730 RepID=A0A833V5U7_9POAL|nr:hypothetical protein FCM35_KLT09101 [Carex littledalei]
MIKRSCNRPGFARSAIFANYFVQRKERFRQRGDMARRVVDVAFKALTAGLGVATIYLTVTFSVNVYRGFTWHSAQSKLEKEKPEE